MTIMPSYLKRNIGFVCNNYIVQPAFNLKKQWMLRKLEQENTKVGRLFFNRYATFPVFRGDRGPERVTGMRPYWIRRCKKTFTTIREILPTPTIYGSEGLVPTSVSFMIALDYATPTGYVYGIIANSKKSVVVATRSLMWRLEQEIATTDVNPNEYVFIMKIKDNAICRFERGLAPLESVPRTVEMETLLNHIAKNTSSMGIKDQLPSEDRFVAQQLLDEWALKSTPSPVSGCVFVEKEYEKTVRWRVANKVGGIKKESYPEFFQSDFLKFFGWK
jgi:hypothetical protein